MSGYVDPLSKSSRERLAHLFLQGDVSSIENLRPDWDALFSSLPHPEPFTRIDWFIAYAQAFEHGSTLRTLTIRDEEALCGVVPFITRAACFGCIPARTLRSLSGKHSCRFDGLASPAKEPAVAESAWQALKSDPWWDAIEALDVPADAVFHEIASLAAADGFPVANWPTLLSPYLPITTAGRDPFTHCPPKHRKTRRRIDNALHKLQKQGPVTLEASTEVNEAMLERFIALEAAGWKGANKSAIGSSSQASEFYRQINTRLSQTGSLLMYTLWCNQQVVAMELGLLEGKTYYSPKVAYAEQFSSFSPGHILTKLIIEDLTTRGVKRYDFLGPRARHKSIWTEHVRPHGHILIFRPTIAGRIRFTFIDTIATKMRHVRRSFRPDPQSLD
jgi:CelD/BcsL family acetyltransferase involved in cellulose biosynthesis